MFKDKPYKDLLVWQRAYQFVLECYRATESFPSHERYGLTSQLRRASTSSVLNIVEGHGRETSKDFLRLLNIARASLWECECLLQLSKDLSYLPEDGYDRLESLRRETDYLLHRFIAAIKKKA